VALGSLRGGCSILARFPLCPLVRFILDLASAGAIFGALLSLPEGVFFWGRLFFMQTCLALLNLGGGEMVFIFLAILILFGSKKIPEFAKGLGQGIKEFKKASSDVSNELHNAMNETPAAPPSAPKSPAAPAQPAAPPATVPKA